MKGEKAVVLLSGGIDSSTTLAIAVNHGYDATAVSFDYGQRHRYELKAAERIARSLNIADHIIVKIDLRQFGSSALTAPVKVPKRRNEKEIGADIPITYVPARNTIFLSLALALAEIRRAQKIFIGANAVDFSGYPDCRPEFFEAFEKMANLGTKAGIEGNRISIETPLIKLSKSEIIKKGMELGLDYSLTSSCYDPIEEGIACGECDSCLIRKKGFAQAGIPDLIKYAEKIRA